MNDKDRERIKSEILNSPLSAELIQLVIRQLGINGLSDEALKRCAAMTKALEAELKKPELELE